MGDKFSAPAGQPPTYRSYSHTGDQSQQQQQNDGRPQRVSWTVGGGPSSISNPGLGTNSPYRAGSTVPQPQRPHTIQVAGTGQAYKPLSGPPPTQRSHGSDVEMSEDDSAPSTPGAPPGYGSKKMEYAHPSGPPPGHASGSHEAEPPPYDPWMGPDDNLHPPPAFAGVRPQNEKSPTANADYDDAARAHAWCREHHLWPPSEHEVGLVQRIEAGDLRLTVPPNTTDVTYYQPALGRSYIRTTATISDTILLSDIPIYASNRQSPLATGKSRTMYFELHVMGMGDRYNPSNIIESGIAIGYIAPPYPAWRLPGWHRASVGVHSDDGRRYVDNSYGGREFTSAFKKGDVVGLGVTLAPPVHGDRVSMRGEVFFTRNGKKEGGWDLHEERDMDADEGDIRGLEGDYDLLAAVGVFGSVELECVFRREEWLFKP